MNRDSGSRNFPIWLIGDSSPAEWEAYLVDPLDSKHPARHNIWTPILGGAMSVGPVTELAKNMQAVMRSEGLERVAAGIAGDLERSLPPELRGLLGASTRKCVRSSSGT